MATTSARPCPACTHAESRDAGEANGFALVRCRSCNTLFTARLPAEAESLDYDEYYHPGNLEVPAFVHARLDELVAGFESYRSLGRWLDVGCGAGTLLEAVRKRGWQAVGTEVSHGAAEAVRSKGFEMHVGQIEELDLPEGSFDVVSLVEVVEHVPLPRSVLSASARLLRPGGALYVTTPHGRGISARVLGADWSVVVPPEHLQLFSARGLRVAARDAGVDVERLRTQAVNPSELLTVLRRKRAAVAPGERVESSYKLNEALSASRRGNFVKSIANSVLTASRLGDSIRLVARRPG